MKTILIYLLIAIVLRCAFEIFNVVADVSPATAPTPAGFVQREHPAVTANEIALFRPWDEKGQTVWLHVHRRSEHGWHPLFVDIESDYKPIVKKIKDPKGAEEWEITFTLP